MANSLLTVISNRPAMPDRRDVPNQPVVPTRPRVAREELAERTRALLLEAETAGPSGGNNSSMRSSLHISGWRRSWPDSSGTAAWMRTISSRLPAPGSSRHAYASIPIKVHLSGLRNPPSAECSSDTFVIMAGPFGRHARLRSSPRVSGAGGQSLVQEMGSLPCTQDLADELGAPVDAVQQARMASEGYSALSIDTAMSRGVCFFSSESDDDKDRIETRLIIDRAVARLEESERRLIWLRFFEQRSQSDIADELGISQMQVSRLLSRLLLKLRTMIGEPENIAAAS